MRDVPWITKHEAAVRDPAWFRQRKIRDDDGPEEPVVVMKDGIDWALHR